jgi:hypothetical protein
MTPAMTAPVRIAGFSTGFIGDLLVSSALEQAQTWLLAAVHRQA